MLSNCLLLIARVHSSLASASAFIMTYISQYEGHFKF